MKTHFVVKKEGETQYHICTLYDTLPIVICLCSKEIAIDTFDHQKPILTDKIENIAVTCNICRLMYFDLIIKQSKGATKARQTIDFPGPQFSAAGVPIPEPTKIEMQFTPATRWQRTASILKQIFVPLVKYAALCSFPTWLMWFTTGLIYDNNLPWWPLYIVFVAFDYFSFWLSKLFKAVPKLIRVYAPHALRAWKKIEPYLK